jgi:hypothetical protein
MSPQRYPQIGPPIGPTHPTAGGAPPPATVPGFGGQSNRHDQERGVDMSAQPVMDTIGIMTAASLENCQLEAREHMLVRVAALAAADAPALSYLANAGAASETGLTLEDVQNVLVAIAPIVGSARVVSAAGNITRALGFAIAVADAELDDD